ncbi:hypothetical protein Q8F55_008170 [Vanrija albida]|uniref:Uncharacterized protein n=1 Tax=Vanrija albida TaxID=181172 RepID=A0ABR3PVW3_9TREE
MSPHGGQPAPAPPRPAFTSPQPQPSTQPDRQLLTTNSLNFRRRLLRQYSVAPPPEYYHPERLAWLPHFSRDLADLVLCLEGYIGPSDTTYLESVIRNYIQWSAFVKKIHANDAELAEELDFLRRLFPRFTKTVLAVARDQDITLPPPVPETILSLSKLPELEDGPPLQVPWRGAPSPKLDTPPTPRPDNTPPTTPAADSPFSSPTSRGFERPATPQRDHPRPYHPLPQPPTRALPPHPPLAVPDSPRSIAPPLSPNPASPRHAQTPSPRPNQLPLAPSPRPAPAGDSRPQPATASPRPPQPSLVPGRPPQPQGASSNPFPQNAPGLRHKSSHAELTQPHLQLTFPTPSTKQPQLQQKSSQHFRVAELSHQLAPPLHSGDDAPPVPPPKGKQRSVAESDPHFYGPQQQPPLSYYNPPAPNPPPSNAGPNSRPNRPQPTVATNPNQWPDRRQPYRPPKLVIPSPLGPVHTDGGWKGGNEGTWDGSGAVDSAWSRGGPPIPSSIVPTPITARAPLAPNPPAPRPSSDYETVRLRANPELLADRPLSHPSSLQRRGAQHQGGIVARRPSTKPKRTLSVRRGGSRQNSASSATGSATPLATYPSRLAQRRGTADSSTTEYATPRSHATYPLPGGRQEIMSDGPVQGYTEFGAMRDPRRQPDQQREYEPRRPSFHENGGSRNPTQNRAREPSWVSIDSEEELRPHVHARPESPYSPGPRPLPSHTPSSLPWDRPKRPSSAASWVTVDSVGSGAANLSPPIVGRAPEPWRDHNHTSSQDWIPQPQRARPVSRHSMDHVPTAPAVGVASFRRESEPAVPLLHSRPPARPPRRDDPGSSTGGRLRRDLSIDSTMSLPPPPPPYGT